MFKSFGSRNRSQPPKQTPFERQEIRDLEPYERQPLSSDLALNLKTVKSELGESNDVVIREFRMGTTGNIHAAIVYTDGLADKNLVSDFVIKSLMTACREDDRDLTPENALSAIKDRALSIGDVKEIRDWKQLFMSVLSGETIVMAGGSEYALAASTKGWENRGVKEPSAQTVIRGPREGFSESIRIKTALIRRKIRSPKLWLEERTIGEVTHTEVGIMYLKGVADERVVRELRKWLDRIRIDGILESGYIEEFIQDQHWTPFPTVYHTERPDIVAAGLLEGRIAVLVDGTPFVLLLPIEFVAFFQSPKDYYQRFDIGNFIRVLRYLSFFVSLLMPSLYVAVVSYHQEMLPTSLFLNLSAQREGVPIPPVVEAFLMEVTFEILREAGVRMPSAVGNTISIVGALVIGQAAVEAGIVSSAMVIIVSITAVTSFVSPAFNMAIAARILRFGFLILAGTLGIYGIAVGLLIFFLHLASLKSFGIPFLKPFAPFVASDQKDAVLRFPHWMIRTRPKGLSPNRVRLTSGQSPEEAPESADRGNEP